jgi:hypothetical protein
MTVTDLPTPQAAPPEDYYRELLFTADRVVQAARTEDPDTIRAVVLAALEVPAEPACGCAVPARVDLQRAVDMLCALAVQVDADVPVRVRAAWTLDVDAINDPPVHPRASIGYAGSGSYGTEDGYHERARRRAS